MQKQEIAAYLITESSAPVSVSNVEVFDKNSLFYLRFEATLQDFNVLNRNKRIYKGQAMIPSLNAEHILELERNGSWFGEAGHPMSDDLKRILTIDPKMICHRIVSHTVTNEFCRGVIETLDTEYGRDMTKCILQGMNPAFSLRALAPLTKDPNGTSIVQTKAHVVTYDAVILPSHRAAYRDTTKPIEKIVKKINADGNTCTESSITPVQESLIKDFITMESANVNLISNVCEVALGSMTLSSDLKHVILKEDNNTFIVPLEDKIKNDINHYMRNL